MIRREFNRLLSLLPLAFLFKPGRYEFRCRECHSLVGRALPQWNVTPLSEDSHSLCADHYDGKQSLVKGYYFECAA